MTIATTKPRFFALIPCAGNGSRALDLLSSRAGNVGPKQYQLLAGRAMVWHTLQAFRALHASLSGVWVLVSKNDDGFLRACPDFHQANEVLLPEGGATRACTVLNGLRALLLQAALPTDWVLVHDAARCLITPAQITALMAACQHDAVGGLLAQPLPDTLKSGAAGRVTSTLDREGKWLAQTPQMFRIGALIAALELAASLGHAVTDESSAMEASGAQPMLVPGSAQNFKVTYPEDFALAEAILLARNSAAQAS